MEMGGSCEDKCFDVHKTHCSWKAILFQYRWLFQMEMRHSGDDSLRSAARSLGAQQPPANAAPALWALGSAAGGARPDLHRPLGLQKGLGMHPLGCKEGIKRY